MSFTSNKSLLAFYLDNVTAVLYAILGFSTFQCETNGLCAPMASCSSSLASNEIEWLTSAIIRDNMAHQCYITWTILYQDNIVLKHTYTNEYYITATLYQINTISLQHCIKATLYKDEDSFNGPQEFVITATLYQSNNISLQHCIKTPKYQSNIVSKHQCTKATLYQNTVSQQYPM